MGLTIKSVFRKLDSQHYVEFFSCHFIPHIHNLDLQNHFQLLFNSRSSRRSPVSRILCRTHTNYFLLMVCISSMPISSKSQTSVYFLPKSADTLSEERLLELPYLTVSTHMTGMKVIYFVQYNQWLKECQRYCSIPMLSLLGLKPPSHIFERRGIPVPSWNIREGA